MKFSFVTKKKDENLSSLRAERALKIEDAENMRDVT